MNLKLFIQGILLAWFLAINIAILVPSYKLIFGSDGAGSAARIQPPDPPQVPAPLTGIGPIDTTLDATKQTQQVEVYKQQVAAYAEQIKGYTQDVAAYTQRVAAYKTAGEVQEKAGPKGVYELVVKGSLVTLLGSFATTLIAFVFANLGAGVMNNVIRMRNSREPEALDPLGLRFDKTNGRDGGNEPPAKSLERRFKMSANKLSAEEDFSMGDATRIAHNCTIDVTGNNHPLEPNSTLEAYGIKTGEQVSLVKNDVETNKGIGLPAFNRTIDPNALKDLTKKWTIADLSDVIFDDSVPKDA